MSSDITPEQAAALVEQAGRSAKRLAALPKSAWEEQLAQQLQWLKLEYAREYMFHPERKWRADFFIPRLLLLIEVEGVSPGGTRHQRIAGFKLDILKYAEAAALGYKLLRVTADMVRNGKAVEFITRIVELVAEPDGPAESRSAAFKRWWDAKEKKDAEKG